MTHAGTHKARSAVDILEEAVHVLKKDALRLVPYYIGSLPFVFALVFFWADMSRGAGAWRHSSATAWGLSVLFLWMKVWQSVFARGLLCGIRGAASASWKPGRILRTLAIQTALQPWAFVAMPVALVAMLPFPRALAFFQNATLYGSGDDREMKAVLRKSWHQAGLWPAQNALLVWLASPFLVVLAALLLFAIVPSVARVIPEPLVLLLMLGGFAMIVLSPLAVVIALNLGISLFFAPRLFQALFGVETALSRNNAWATNDLFIVILCCLVYLFLDPLLKACYCLRCFYGESLRTGEDLKVELRGLRRLTPVAIVALTLFFGAASWDCSWAGGAPASHRTSVSPAELDAALDRTIRLPRYEWHMPRETPPSTRGNSVLRTFLAPVIKVVRAVVIFSADLVSKLVKLVMDFLFRVVPQPSTGTSRTRTFSSMIFVVAALLCLVAVFTFLGWRMWRKRKPVAQAEATAAPPLPDITREEVDASALPEDGWMEMARDFAEKGELRYAVRALYLATLAFLGRRRFITLERHKSDREYERELSRRTQADPRLAPLFAESRGLFERTWYGLHEATPGLIERIRANHERMREHDQP